MAGADWLRGELGNGLSKVARATWYRTLYVTVKTLGFILREVKPSEGSDQRSAVIWLSPEKIIHPGCWWNVCFRSRRSMEAQRRGGGV